MTRLTTARQVFNRPVFQQQGPDDNCKVTKNGVTYYLGWDSCTTYAGAMGEDGTTGGVHRPSGCAVRRATGDVSGGTTLRQVADALMELYGTFVATYTGENVIAPSRVAAYARAGRRVMVQGGAGAMVGTSFQSTAGDVNHCIVINEVRGGTVAEPDEALVYDSAADGRKRAYHVDQGPTWWPWSMVKKFASWLRPNGPGTPRLGGGMVYAGVFPDTEPHVRLLRGAVKSHPFPDRTRAAKTTVWIHSNLKKGTASRLYSVPKGTLLVGYQYGRGDTYQGSDLWLGNDDGNEWVHTKNLSHVGGTT